MRATLLEKISFLNETSFESFKLRTEKAIIAKFMEAGIKVLGANFGFSFIRDSGKREFRLAYKTQDTPYQPIKPRRTGITAKAFQSREPQMVSDVLKESLIREDARQTMKAVAVVPISYKEANYGTLDFCFYKVHQFNEEEKILCEFIGRSAAEALTIFRLIRERKKALKDQENFLALASHELKTPITSMKISTQYLLSLKDKGNKDSREKEGLELINQQIIRLTRLVNDLLVFNKSRSKQLEIHPTTFNVHELIVQMLKHLRVLADSRKVIYEGKRDLLVRADKSQIEQVLINIISNAIKYSPSQSKITLSAQKEGNRVIVAINDEGEGIPKELKKQIFNRYFQIRSASPGFGLGLYITKRLIEQHKGHIWVDSKPGRGSTFYFSLPSGDSS